MLAGIFLLVFALSASAMFAGSETGYYSINPLELRYQARTQKRAAILAAVVRHPAAFLCTLLVGNNLANHLAVQAGSWITAPWGWSEYHNTIWLTPLVFLTGEVGPKQFILSDPLRRTLPLSPYLRLSSRLLAIVTTPLVWLTRLFGEGEGQSMERSQLSHLLLQRNRSHKREEPVFQALERALELKGAGLTPFLRTDLPILTADLSLQEALKAVAQTTDASALLESPHGPPRFVSGADLVLGKPGQTLRDLAVDLPYVSPDLDLATALAQLTRQQASRALVVHPLTRQWLGVLDLEVTLARMLSPPAEPASGTSTNLTTNP